MLMVHFVYKWISFMSQWDPFFLLSIFTLVEFFIFYFFSLSFLLSFSVSVNRYENNILPQDFTDTIFFFCFSFRLKRLRQAICKCEGPFSDMINSVWLIVYAYTYNVIKVFIWLLQAIRFSMSCVCVFEMMFH